MTTEPKRDWVPIATGGIVLGLGLVLAPIVWPQAKPFSDIGFLLVPFCIGFLAARL